MKTHFTNMKTHFTKMQRGFFDLFVSTYITVYSGEAVFIHPVDDEHQSILVAKQDSHFVCHKLIGSLNQDGSGRENIEVILPSRKELKTFRAVQNYVYQHLTL